MRLLIIRKAKELQVKSRSIIRIKKTDEEIIDRPLRDIEAVLVIGSTIKISSGLPPVLAYHNIPLSIIAKDSIAILHNPIKTRSNHIRYLQYTLSTEKKHEIALEYIKTKIKGIQNIIKYHTGTTPTVPDPPSLTGDTETDEETIRTWESLTSSKLWKKLTTLIKPRYLKTLKEQYNFKGRKPRHPDPFNKTLSVMYAVIYSIATKALAASGLDPTQGFLHKTRYSTPLTFDFTEMYKPLAIHATISMINKHGLPKIGNDGELTQEHINQTIKYLYQFLTLRHKKTNKSIHTIIYLKAICLARHLEGKCPMNKITFTWDKRNYIKK